VNDVLHGKIDRPARWGLMTALVLLLGVGSSGCVAAIVGVGAAASDLTLFPDYRARAQGLVTFESAGSLAHVSASTGGGGRVYVRELDISMAVPRIYLPYRQRYVTQEEWDTAAVAWRDRFAMMLVNVVQDNVPEVAITVISDDVTPSSGLLLSSRLHHLRLSLGETPWGYFSLTLTDLARGEEVYYARVEVPLTEGATGSWIDDPGFIVVSYAHLMEHVITTGHLGGARMSEEEPVLGARATALWAEFQYWNAYRAWGQDRFDDDLPPGLDAVLQQRQVSLDTEATAIMSQLAASP
jgi:hypothetical protein